MLIHAYLQHGRKVTVGVPPRPRSRFDTSVLFMYVRLNLHSVVIAEEKNEAQLILKLLLEFVSDY